MANQDLQAGLGFRAHSGWAVLVAVAGPLDNPTIIKRWRIQLTDPLISGSAQPYHAAAEMKIDAAKAFLDRCADVANTLAAAALRDAIAFLIDGRHKLAGACVLSGSGRPLPDLATTLRAHALIHTAEGEFFRDALRRACSACHLATVDLKEGELVSQAVAELGMPIDELKHRVSELGRRIGAPWRQDEKLCAMAGWLVLVKQRDGNLPLCHPPTPPF